jgi:hypothetical protein
MATESNLMNIEIDFEVANGVASAVMMQNYKALIGDGYYDGETSLRELIDSFRTVIEYSTTAQQRLEHGIEW